MIFMLSVKSGQLCLHENDVWRLCLDWAVRRCSLLSREPGSWSEQERGRLRLEVEGVVEHIKIQMIDHKVYTEEVEPTGLFNTSQG